MMPKQTKLTHNEIKMINELLDGQLTSADAKQAFLLIEQDQELRSAYDHLRWTKSLLRQAPRRKVPHNYTLTREMAREATGFYRLRRQTFSIAGALASFLFVVLLAVQLVPIGFNLAMPSLIKSEDIAMMDEVAAPEMMEAVPEVSQEELMEDAEVSTMNAEPLEEEAAEEEMAEEPMMLEAPAEAEEAAPKETEVQGEGMDSEQDEMDFAAAETESEADAGDPRFDEEGDQAEADLPAEESVEEERVGGEEEQEQNAFSENWLFTTTVLSGLLGFFFIFISIRDKNRENLIK